jgi:hypothetical protein
MRWGEVRSSQGISPRNKERGRKTQTKTKLDISLSFPVPTW